MDNCTFLNSSVSTLSPNFTLSLPPRRAKSMGLSDVAIYSTVGVFCLVIDVITFWAVRSRRGPPTNFSMLNLFISSVIAVVYPIVKMLKDNHLITIGPSPWLCNCWGFFLRYSLALLPSTMVGIFYEMTNAKRLSQTGTMLKVKVFLSVWAATFLLSLPGLGTYRMNEDSNCLKVCIMDSKLLQITYEGIYTFLISAVPSIYMIFG
ncbi:uncharacterized protein LOC118435040 [Folsomia candida]|uniref:uncharacterized protein LOC118435040 n=1 Tax=Folsomia candida TaxID=158441 RepID=UPI001604FD16|nr:uncharacterized protein LOC118435040 [Folsomia candida]